MSDHSGIVVKVLVDEIFYEKCLAAYHELERTKTTKSTKEVVHNRGSNLDPELEGAGIVFHDPPEIVPRTDGIPKQNRTPARSTIVMSPPAPLIIPAAVDADAVRSSLPKEVSKKKSTKPRQKKKKKATTHVSTSFKRQAGMPWYYIGLKD